jgi:hypothetical protein
MPFGVIELNTLSLTLAVPEKSWPEGVFRLTYWRAKLPKGAYAVSSKLAQQAIDKK